MSGVLTGAAIGAFSRRYTTGFKYCSQQSEFTVYKNLFDLSYTGIRNKLERVQKVRIWYIKFE